MLHLAINMRISTSIMQKLFNKFNFFPEKLSSPPASNSSPNSSSGFGPLGSFPPGFLSSALLGNTNSPSGGGHPPTPPRTPKSAGPEMQQPRFPMPIKLPGSPASGPPTSHHMTPTSSAPSSISGGHPHNNPNMPPLLSLAAIHDQVNKSPNILAAHLNKPMMHPGKQKIYFYFKPQVKIKGGTYLRKKSWDLPYFSQIDLLFAFL